MTDCKFKIGETYKDRAKEDWVLVARNDEYERPLVFRHKISGRVSDRYLNGRVYQTRRHTYDVRHGCEPEWLVLYDLGDGELSLSCESLEEAEQIVGEFLETNRAAVSVGSPLVYESVRGPFVPESED